MATFVLVCECPRWHWVYTRSEGMQEFTPLHWLVAMVSGSWGPDVERERERQKGKTWSEGKNLWPQPLRISLPCYTVVPIKLIVLSDVYAWLNLVMSEANHRQGSKSEPNTDMEVRLSSAKAFPSLQVVLFAVSLSTLGPLEPGYENKATCQVWWP